MTFSKVIELLKQHSDPERIKRWNQRPRKATELKSFGIGLTQLRKLAKTIGRDTKLAQQLWKSNVYDARLLGLMLDDPKTISRQQAEAQVQQLSEGLLAHVFASCDATLAKSPIALELACDWTKSKDDMRRRCGYTLLYELSKKKTKAIKDAFLMEQVLYISRHIENEPPMVKGAMAGALLGIGKRTRKLNQAAIKIAKTIGPIKMSEHEDDACEPFDLLKHLTSDYIKKKLFNG